MPLDPAALHATLHSIHGKLTRDEVGAIIDVARLAAAADGKSDVDEMIALIEVGKVVCQMAGLNALPFPTIAVDAKRLFEISMELVPTGPRELAFACAYIIMAQDLVVTEEERALAKSLGEALVIEGARLAELTAQMERFVRNARA